MLRLRPPRLHLALEALAEFIELPFPAPAPRTLKEEQLARQLRLARSTRREEVRKIILGTLVLEMLARGEWAEEEVMDDLDRFLLNPRQRVLFNFLPRPFQRVRSLRAAGHSQRAIAQILEAEGVHPGRYRRWDREAVRQILGRAAAADNLAPARKET